MFTQAGTRFTPNPIPSAIIAMKRFRRVRPSWRLRTWTPDTTTPVKRNVVMAPRTQLGMERMMAANLAMTPRINNQKQHAMPARRDAHRESEMTPLFCAYVVTGVKVAREPQKEFKPSANTAPWMVVSKSGPACHQHGLGALVHTRKEKERCHTMKSLTLLKIQILKLCKSQFR